MSSSPLFTGIQQPPPVLENITGTSAPFAASNASSTSSAVPSFLANLTVAFPVHTITLPPAPLPTMMTTTTTPRTSLLLSALTMTNTSMPTTTTTMAPTQIAPVVATIVTLVTAAISNQSIESTAASFVASAATMFNNTNSNNVSASSAAAAVVSSFASASIITTSNSTTTPAPASPYATTGASGTTTAATMNSFMFDGLLLSKFNSNLSNQQSSDLIYSRPYTALFSVIYLLILVGGLCGNVLVCYVVVRNRSMQTVTNMFITNLAVSDILMCLLCLPFTPAYMYMRRWPFGLVMCHTVAFAQTTSVYISTLTLMAIAIDRFSVIMHPFQQRMRMRQCIAVIALIWAASLLFSSPFGWYQHLVPANITGTWDVYCEEQWGEGTRRLFATLTTVLQFVVPFVVIAFCYTSVSIRLTMRAKLRPGNKTSKKDEVDRERKRRTNRMLVYMVVVFGLVWLPLNTINLLNDWYIINAEESDYYNICFILSHLFAMSSTCYNPVLYAWKNDNFRKEFQTVLPCYKPPERVKSGLAGFGGSVGLGGGGGGGTGEGGRRSSRSGCGGSQRWQPEQTYNGNNETMQESLLTSSYVRSTGLSVASTQCNPIESGAIIDDHILLSDIEPSTAAKALGLPLGKSSPAMEPATMRIPETHVLPSGVLETNFEEVTFETQQQRQQVEQPQRTVSKSADGNGDGGDDRIRLDDDRPNAIASTKANCMV